MKTIWRSLGFACGLAAAGLVHAELTIEIHRVTEAGLGEAVGTVTAKDGQYGLLLTPALKGLEPGLHGFHVHQSPDCGAAPKDGKMTAGLAAGGHYDPQDSKAHQGPYENSGHRGDLPPLYVNSDGNATTPVLAPRLKAADLQGHSLMIHKGGDNFSDQPEPLGGGGARVACGVVK